MGTERRVFRGSGQALSTEEKILVVNAWDLLDKTRERASKVRGMDLTMRLQLRSDCAALEKALRAFEKEPGPGGRGRLEKAVTLLKTSAEHILDEAEDGFF